MAPVGKHSKPSGDVAAGGSSSVPQASPGTRFAHSDAQAGQDGASERTQVARRVGTRFKTSSNDAQAAARSYGQPEAQVSGAQEVPAPQETMRMPSARPMQPTSENFTAAPDLSQYTYEAQEPTKPKKLPFVVGIVGMIVACGSGLFSIVGIALGVAALVLRFRATKGDAGCKAPRATLVLGILALIFGVAMFAYVPKGAIEVSVRAEEWESSYGDVQIDVTGTTDDGEKVDLSVAVTPGQTKELDDLEAGNYELTVDAGELSFDDAVYQVDPARHSVAFDGKTDEAVEFVVTVDGQATQKLIAEKAAAEKKAAEEKAAKAQEEAEHKAQEEAERREKEEAEKKAQEEAEREAEEKRQAEEAAAASNTGDQQAEQQAPAESDVPETDSPAETTGVNTGDQSQTDTSAPGDPIVYYTPNGEKYHTEGCSTLSRSKTIEHGPRSEVSLTRDACEVCNP